MRKTISVILALVLAFSLSAGLAAEADLTGEWYAGELGMDITLTLAGDGTYTIVYAGAGEPAAAGAWTEDDGFILLDGGENGALAVLDGMLRTEGGELNFTRVKPEAYVPAGLIPDAAPGDFDGYWTSAWVEMNGVPVAACAAGDTTDLYFEGTMAALGGPLFGDVIVEMEAADGALAFGGDTARITAGLQEDGYLRLTVTAGDESMVIWLLRAPEEDGDAE